MKQKSSRKIPIKVNLEEETYNKIAEKAERKGLSKSGIVRSIVRTHLES